MTNKDAKKGTMKLLETNHPFFKPLWIRILVVAIAAAWGVFEFASGSAFWGTLFLGIAAYAAWGFFIAFDPDAAEDKAKTETDKD